MKPSLGRPQRTNAGVERTSSPMTVEEQLARAGVTLQEGESIAARSIIHEAIYWKGVAVCLLGLFLLPTHFLSLGVFFIFVGVVMLGIAHVSRRFLILLATDKRVIARSGLIYADMVELRYSQVESVELGMTVIGQILGYGNVVITGTGQRRVIVPFVKNAQDFKRRVNDILVNRE
jgi:uncharacterized membrane protein YdbT with pleckstrin-like domain